MPLKGFVTDQKDVPQMTEAEMNDLLINILAFCQINFQAQQCMSQNELSIQYQDFSKEIEFGKKNTQSYRAMLSHAELLRDKLNGGTTWIDQTQEERILPSAYAEYRSTLAPMGPTSGGLFEGSNVTKWNDWGW